MTETQTLTLAEFLLARIAERLHLADIVEQEYDPDWIRADAEAKRQIVTKAQAMGDDGLYRAPYMGPARDFGPNHVGSGHMYPGHPSYVQTIVYGQVLQDLALPYADHPDYNPDWRP